jgi:hypothetical protein
MAGILLVLPGILGIRWLKDGKVYFRGWVYKKDNPHFYWMIFGGLSLGILFPVGFVLIAGSLALIVLGRIL